MTKLSDIINFNYPFKKLLPLLEKGDTSINPFEISLDSKVRQDYAIDLFQQYMVNYNGNRNDKFMLRTFLRKSVDNTLDERAIMHIVFRLHQFQIIQPFDFPTNGQTLKVIDAFFDYVLQPNLTRIVDKKRLCIDDKENLKDRLKGYWKFSVFLSVQAPKLDYDTPLSRITVGGNALKPLIGSFYPKLPFNDNHDSEVILRFIRSAASFSNYKAFEFSSIDSLAVSSEGDMQSKFNDLYWKHLITILRNSFSNLTLTANKSVSSSISNKKIRVIPDIVLKLGGEISIPVELKFSDMGRSFASFEESYGDFTRAGLDFTDVFTQSIQQAFTIGSRVCMICDATNIIWIELENATLDMEFYKPERGRIMRGLKCKVIHLNSIEVNLSPSTILLCFVEEYGKVFDTSFPKFVKQLFDSSEISPEIKRQIMSSNYILLDRLFIELDTAATRLQKYVKEDSRQSFKEKTMISAPASSSDHFKEEVDSINNTLGLGFQPEILKGWSILKHYENWESTSIEKLKLKYRFVEIVSGARCHSTFGIIIKVQDFEGNYFGLKLYESYRSYIYKSKQGDLITSIQKTFSYFAKEVTVYNEANSSNIPKIRNFGILKHNANDAVRYGTDLTVGNLPVCAFYFLYDWIDGTLSSNMKTDITLEAIVFAAIRCLHEEGFVHQDLHPRNIIIIDKGGEKQVKFIDFGVSAMTGIRKKRGAPLAIQWLWEDTLESKTIDKRKEKDISDLTACFSNGLQFSTSEESCL